MDVGPIDLVYLWCDSSDKEWNDKRKKYRPSKSGEEKQSNNECRFISNDELKYSLRSVARYAPWINHIYIISDHQTPKWLNTDNPKVTMVNHEDILPHENLPLFNSEAIEIGLANIPGLSENFLYACDDMFFGNNVYPEDFFNKKGQAIYRAIKNKMKYANESLYTRHILEMQKLIKIDFGKECNYQPHHNIDAYKKSEFIDCLKYYDDFVKVTAKQRFREEKAFSRVMVNYWMICKNKSVLKKLHRGIYRSLGKFSFIRKLLRVDSLAANIDSKKGLYNIVNLRPKMFCLNDCEAATNTDRKNIQALMESMFPNKSEFEQ